MNSTVKVHNAIEFSRAIEQLKIERECGYIETIVDYCTESGIELELVPKLLTPILKSKLREEGEELHFLVKKSSKLEFLD